MADRRQVRIGYRPRSGVPHTVQVEPWAVVVRGGLWYLLGLAHGPDAPRTYRVDRVVALEVLADRCAPPADLDAVGWLERHLGTGRAFATSVLFAAPAEAVAPWVSPTDGRAGRRGRGRLPAHRHHRQPARCTPAEWLAAIPFPLTVEGGPELRAAVGALAGRLAAALELSRGLRTARTSGRDGP